MPLPGLVGRRGAAPFGRRAARAAPGDPGPKDRGTTAIGGRVTMTPVKTLSLPEPLSGDVRSALNDWLLGGKARRLWEGDASLWTGADEARWLGWLGVVDEERARVQELGVFAGEVRAAGFKHALLLGMGGSSLCPEVLRATFGFRPGSPDLRVLASTYPAEVRAGEAGVGLERTLFIVGGHPGTPLDPN